MKMLFKNQMMDICAVDMAASGEGTFCPITGESCTVECIFFEPVIEPISSEIVDQSGDGNDMKHVPEVR